MAYVALRTDPYAAHQRLLRLCGSPRTVLDVGGSSGYLASELAKRGARVVVIDNDPQAVAEARQAGVDAHVVDITREDPPETPGGYEAALLGDVLEHLADPAAVLRRLRPFVAPGGRLVASVPNGANWALRLSLLAGRWNYTDRGLLDRTHLRNFTRRTFLDTLRAGGFEVVETDVTCPIPVLRGGRLSAAAHAAARALPGLLAYQHLALARPLAEK
ncbi:MAG: class I SAM-dependent methyltransferase [Chloroflexi bacterium]|nr:MAG: class I SAM-dependent methyltransferase [Chloroflexota bacterium]